MVSTVMTSTVASARAVSDCVSSWIDSSIDMVSVESEREVDKLSSRTVATVMITSSVGCVEDGAGVSVGTREVGTTGMTGEEERGKVEIKETTRSRRKDNKSFRMVDGCCVFDTTGTDGVDDTLVE